MFVLACPVDVPLDLIFLLDTRKHGCQYYNPEPGLRFFDLRHLFFLSPKNYHFFFGNDKKRKIIRCGK